MRKLLANSVFYGVLRLCSILEMFMRLLNAFTSVQLRKKEVSILGKAIAARRSEIGKIPNRTERDRLVGQNREKRKNESVLQWAQIKIRLWFPSRTVLSLVFVYQFCYMVNWTRWNSILWFMLFPTFCSADNEKLRALPYQSGHRKISEDLKNWPRILNFIREKIWFLGYRKTLA